MCMPWKAILIRIFLGYAAYVNREREREREMWRGQPGDFGHTFPLKGGVELI